MRAWIGYYQEVPSIVVVVVAAAAAVVFVVAVVRTIDWTETVLIRVRSLKLLCNE